MAAHTSARASLEPLRSWVVSAYAWVVAILLGMVLMDITYARLAPEASAAFIAVADLLLVMIAITQAAGLVASVVAWPCRITVALFVASILALFLEFLLPVLFPSLVGIGPLLRIIPPGLASLLALVGLRSYCRQSG